MQHCHASKPALFVHSNRRRGDRLSVAENCFSIQPQFNGLLAVVT